MALHFDYVNLRIMKKCDNINPEIFIGNWLTLGVNPPISFPVDIPFFKIAITKVDDRVTYLQERLNPLKDLTFLPFSAERKIYQDYYS